MEEYSFVEVNCSDGTQYGLQAYGNEALEPNRVAAKFLKISPGNKNSTSIRWLSTSLINQISWWNR